MKIILILYMYHSFLMFSCKIHQLLPVTSRTAAYSLQRSECPLFRDYNNKPLLPNDFQSVYLNNEDLGLPIFDAKPRGPLRMNVQYVFLILFFWGGNLVA